MSDQVNGSRAIQTGTADGLLQFLDWVVEKGYGPATAAGPQKSAVRQVLTITEGEDFGDLDIKNLDIADLLNRFAVRARGELKAESINTYRSRFSRAVDAYRQFLDTGTPPSYRSHVRRPRHADGGKPKSSRRTETLSATPGAAAPTTPSDRMVDYPFPLKSGGLANFRLPVRLEREDAERMASFIRALVFETQKQPEPRDDREDD